MLVLETPNSHELGLDLVRVYHGNIFIASHTLCSDLDLELLAFCFFAQGGALDLLFAIWRSRIAFYDSGLGARLLNVKGNSIAVAHLIACLRRAGGARAGNGVCGILSKCLCRWTNHKISTCSDYWRNVRRCIC